MARDPAGEALAASLPVAGRTGTLVHRMRGTAAQDRCQAKTGTLHDVSALAGYCTTTAGLPRGLRVPHEPHELRLGAAGAGPHDGLPGALLARRCSNRS